MKGQEALLLVALALAWGSLWARIESAAGGMLAAALFLAGVLLGEALV